MLNDDDKKWIQNAAERRVADHTGDSRMKRYDLLIGLGYHMTEQPQGLYVLHSEANDRIVELEACALELDSRHTTARVRGEKLEKHRDELALEAGAANARADAAEGRRVRTMAALDQLATEAAALRAEATQVTRERDVLLKHAIAEAGHAIALESEAAALRADVDRYRELMQAAVSQRDDALARIAELETERDGHYEAGLRLADELRAANSRAKLAEKKAMGTLITATKYLGELRAANARADAAERVHRETMRDATGARLAAESEAAALRAEVERLTALLESRRD